MQELSSGSEEFRDVIGSHEIQSLMDYFYSLTRIGIAILDLKGEILVHTGWQDVCVKFHRMHPTTQNNCIESDTYLSQNVRPGEYLVYKCKNNMWDMVTPIYVGDRHLGNLFLGQFFFEDEVADYDVFIKQAETYGFDKDDYLDALERVPRWSRSKVEAIMNFYTGFASLISRLSYSNLELARSLKDLNRADAALREAQNHLEKLVEIRTVELLREQEQLKAEIETHKKTQKALNSQKQKLSSEQKHLQEANTALKVLLKHREEDRKEIEKKVLSNISKLVLPYVDKLQNSGLKAGQSGYLDVMRANLNDIISPFLQSLSAQYMNFTPREIEIANLVHGGRTAKDIAGILNISARSVEFHKDNIRKKLGLTNKRVNLHSHLMSLTRFSE